MRLEEEFQGMLKASYKQPINDMQMIDMRRAFMAGCLIGLKAGLRGGTDALTCRNDLLVFFDMVGIDR